MPPNAQFVGPPGGKQVLLQHRAIGGKDRDAWTRPASLPTTGGDDVAVRVLVHMPSIPRASWRVRRTDPKS